MYWSRTGSLLDIALYLLLCLGWSLGGCLLVTYAYRVRASERLLSGLATGLVLFIALSNLLAHGLPLSLAFWGASGVILLSGLGLAAAARFRKDFSPAWPNWRVSLGTWPQLVLLLGLTFLFELIGRGLAIFDDYLHIPLVSVMASGDIPPHFYLDPSKYFSYHYALQVLAASLVRLGGFFPWSAWDLSKALAIALTMVLGWLWIRRVTRSQMAAYLGAFLVAFAGGTRWLLLFVPTSILVRISSGIQMINTGADTAPTLVAALARPWVAEGSGPYPFPFAFHNGIFLPVIFALGSSGALPFLIVILLLLLANKRRFSVPGIIVLSLIFAVLALSAEHIFAFLWAGIVLGGLIYLLRMRLGQKPFPRDLILSWGAILLISGILSVIQGGFITETVRSLLLSLRGTASAQGHFNYLSLTPRWPPLLDSGHFSPLSPLIPSQLLVILAELGPALLLAPMVSWYAWRRIRQHDWLSAGLGIAAALSLLVAFFFRYGVERSSTRLPWTALWIWVLLGFPLLWRIFQKSGNIGRFWIRLGYGVTVFGGIVIFAVQLTAIPAPQLTYFVNANDARISRDLWNQLPQGAQVLDRVPYRAVALFGRASKANQDIYYPLPEWEDLIKNPNPTAIAQAGYSFVYIDAKWWWEMSADQRDSFTNPCVKVVTEQKPSDEDYRWLLDVRACR